MKFDFKKLKAWLARPPSHNIAVRVVVGVIGVTVVLFGIALLVLPGPAFIVIPIGFSILATQFYWARRWLKKARELARKSKEKIKSA